MIQILMLQSTPCETRPENIYLANHKGYSTENPVNQSELNLQVADAKKSAGKVVRMSYDSVTIAFLVSLLTG